MHLTTSAFITMLAIVVSASALADTEVQPRIAPVFVPFPSKNTSPHDQPTRVQSKQFFALNKAVPMPMYTSTPPVQPHLEIPRTSSARPAQIMPEEQAKLLLSIFGDRG